METTFWYSPADSGAGCRESGTAPLAQGGGPPGRHGRAGPRARRSGVACRWRIRHKLLLGLGLVAALVAVLLAGALKGLDSYHTTIKTLDGNLVSLHHAVKLRSLVQQLNEP